MRKLLLLPVLLLACVETTMLVPLATPVMTETAIPSATVGYVDTQAVLAQAALDAARTNVAYESLHVAATVQASQFTAQADGWTHEAALREDEYFKATGTAYETVIPATKTAQAIIQTFLVIRSTELVVTLDAPSMVVAMAQAQAQAEYADEYALAQVVALLSIPVMVAGLLAFLGRQWSLSDMIPPASGNETYHFPRVGGADLLHVSNERAEQLRYLAVGLYRQGKSLAINQWEVKGSPFSAAEYGELRNWLMQNKLTVSTGKGELILAPDGDNLLRKHLPRSGYVTPSNAPPPSMIGETTRIEAVERGAL